MALTVRRYFAPSIGVAEIPRNPRLFAFQSRKSLKTYSEIERHASIYAFARKETELVSKYSKPSPLSCKCLSLEIDMVLSQKCRGEKMSALNSTYGSERKNVVLMPVLSAADPIRSKFTANN